MSWDVHNQLIPVFAVKPRRPAAELRRKNLRQLKAPNTPKPMRVQPDWAKKQFIYRSLK